MFWMQRRIWIECFVMIFVACVVTIFAWATNDTPAELTIKLERMASEKALAKKESDLDLRIATQRVWWKIKAKNKEIEFFNSTVVKPLTEFKGCVARCSKYSMGRGAGWRFSEPVMIGEDTLSNRRFEFLLRCNQTCFVEYSPGQ